MGKAVSGGDLLVILALQGGVIVLKGTLARRSGVCILGTSVRYGLGVA